jgi:hypothetical protein
MLCVEANPLWRFNGPLPASVAGQILHRRQWQWNERKIENK